MNRNDTQNVKTQTCNGGICRSHDMSWFVHFRLGSDIANNLLNIEGSPYYYDEISHKRVMIKVLQIISYGEYVVAEIVRSDDYYS